MSSEQVASSSVAGGSVKDLPMDLKHHWLSWLEEGNGTSRSELADSFSAFLTKRGITLEDRE